MKKPPEMQMYAGLIIWRESKRFWHFFIAQPWCGFSWKQKFLRTVIKWTIGFAGIWAIILWHFIRINNDIAYLLWGWFATPIIELYRLRNPPKVVASLDSIRRYHPIKEACGKWLYKDLERFHWRKNEQFDTLILQPKNGRTILIGMPDGELREVYYERMNHFLHAAGVKNEAG